MTGFKIIIKKKDFIGVSVEEHIFFSVKLNFFIDLF